MIIDLEHARHCYEEIVKLTKKHNGKVVIFVGFDIDSLCSLRILVTLLRADNIKYEIIPVMNYDQLDSKLEEFKVSYGSIGNDSHKAIKAFVMINCGGTRDLSKHWFCDTECDIMCLLIDVNRPSHHNNINQPRNIIVINDKNYEIENCPKDEDLQELENEVDEESEKEEEEEESDDELNGDNDRNDNLSLENVELGQNSSEDGKKNLLKRENVSDTEESDDDNFNGEQKLKRLKKKSELEIINEENEDEIDKIINDLKHPRNTKSALRDEKNIRKKVRHIKRMKIENYYSGNYFGFPASYVLYKIAEQLHREEINTLWYLIISVTDHYIQCHIDQNMYDELYNECHKEVLRLNQNKSRDNNTSTRRNKIKREEQSESHPPVDSKYDYSDIKVKTVNKDMKSISLESDYRLILYRHWNIFDSFIYSNYVAGNYLTWKESGREEIKKLLTYIGIPLEEAKQKYSSMKNEFKTLFNNKLVNYSNSFNIKDILFHSFVYQYNQKTQLSASDFAYCLSSILDYPFNLNKIENTTGEDLYNYLDVDDDEDDKKNESDPNINFSNEEKNMRMNHRYENFWTAYDFLSFKHQNLVKLSIDLAVKFQIACVNKGTPLIDKRSLSASQNFRYSIIGTDDDEMKYFHNALSLEKLALFILETYHTLHRNDKGFLKKPFVLAVWMSSTNSYLVAGVMGNSKYSDKEKNQFPIRFRLTANKLGARLILNNFNDCIVEISKDDFTDFFTEMSKV